MKHNYLLFFLSIAVIWFQSSPAWSAVEMQRSVNAVIGDRSYFARFGEAPSSQTSEKVRIQTHLAYVETQLRETTPLVISPALYSRRQALLNHLHAYWQQGVFPTQTAYAGRRPHFIDEQGRLCAVGYLVAKTAGLPLAQAINTKHRYAYLPEMDLPGLNDWVANSGLTVTELAMIQPSYNSSRSPATADLGLEGTWLGLSYLVSYLFIPQLFFFAMSAENYLQFQYTHHLITYGLLGLYVLVSMFLLTDKSFKASGSEGNIVLISVVSASALGASLLANGVILNGLGEVKQEEYRQQSLAIRQFQLADGNSAFGLYSSFQF